MKRYSVKLKESFETKLNYYVFNQVMHNQDSGSWSDFLSFTISAEIIDGYNGQYWQFLPEHEVKLNDIVKTVNEIEKGLQSWRSSNASIVDELRAKYAKRFEEKIFPKEQFEKLIEGSHCHYCKKSIDDFMDLADKSRIFKKNYRGWNLEIERLNPHIEYNPENCVMACYWCNNAKTDEFTADEFAKIGKVIEQIWNERKDKEIMFKPIASSMLDMEEFKTEFMNQPRPTLTPKQLKNLDHLEGNNLPPTSKERLEILFGDGKKPKKGNKE